MEQMSVSDPRVNASAAAPAAAPSAPFMLLPDLHWLWRLELCVLLLWSCAIWTHQLVLPQRPGWRRLLAAAPAVAALIAAPFLFHPLAEPILTMTVTFMSVRMPLTKLLAACYGRGPLMALPLQSSPRAAAAPAAARLCRKLRSWQWWRRPSRFGVTEDSRSSERGGRYGGGDAGRTTVGVPDLALVTFFMMCPVVPRGCRTDGCDGGGKEEMTEAAGTAAPAGGGGGRSHGPRRDLHPTATHSAVYRGATGDRRLLLRELAGKWMAFAVASALAVRYGRTAPLALHAALAYGMLALMGGMMDLTALYCISWWGMDLVPPFHNPFQATSLSDFWGRRWNVTQSRVLKGLLYDPIVEGRLVPEGPGADDDKRDGGEAAGGDCYGGGAVCEADPCASGPGCGDSATEQVVELSHPQLRRRRQLLPPTVPQGGGGGTLGGTAAGGGQGEGDGWDSHRPPAKAGQLWRVSSRRSGSIGASSSGYDSDGGGRVRLSGLRKRLERRPGGSAVWVRSKAGSAAAPEVALRGAASGASDPDSPEAPATPVTGAAAAGCCFQHEAAPGALAAAAAAAATSSAAGAPVAPAVLAAAASAVAAVASLERLGALRAATSLRDPRTRRAVALLVVFAFSGIEHEVFHWYVQRFVSGHWFTFFTVHGFLLLAEGAVRRKARAAAAAASAAASSSPSAADCDPQVDCNGLGTGLGTGGGGGRGGGGGGGRCRRAVLRLLVATWCIPPWAQQLLTLGVLELTASLWFFKVLLEPGIVGRTAAALRGMVPELMTR